MEGLQDTLRDQQDLSDDAFRQLQEQFGGQPGAPQQGQPGNQQGQTGEQPQGRAEGEGQGEGERPGPPGTEQGEGQGGDNGSMSLAERQEALRRQLEDQAGRLPGTGTEEGDEALRQLDEAGRAMDEAADALENGDIAGALDLQSDAMEAMREGMTALGRALAEEQGREPGQGQAEGAMPTDRPLQDPLGRQAGNAGSFGSDENIEAREEAFRRARELLDELAPPVRRSGPPRGGAGIPPPSARPVLGPSPAPPPWVRTPSPVRQATRQIVEPKSRDIDLVREPFDRSGDGRNGLAQHVGVDVDPDQTGRQRQRHEETQPHAAPPLRRAARSRVAASSCARRPGPPWRAASS
jgi:hypothetical protein